MVFPELGLTSYTCGDLFFQASLIQAALDAVRRIAAETAGTEIISVVGLPIALGDKLYNAAAFLKSGDILGFVTKLHLPNYSEFYEARHFSVLHENTTVPIDGKEIPIGPNLLFCAENLEAFRVGAEICEDLWVPIPPSTQHVLNGATVIVNLSASNEIIGKDAYRHILLESQSSRGVCAYLYADAGQGESTTDLVFGGHNLIYEDGTLLAESRPFQESVIYADIDLEKIVQERRRMTTFQPETVSGYRRIYFRLTDLETKLEREFDPFPLCAQHGDSGRTVRGDFCHPIPWPEKAAVPYWVEDRDHRHLRRAGQHAGPAGNGAGLRQPRSAPVRHCGGDHALLRHYGPHL